MSRQFRHVFNVRVHEGALNDAINYAQKGWAMQMLGITLKVEVSVLDTLPSSLLLTAGLQQATSRLAIG